MASVTGMTAEHLQELFDNLQGFINNGIVSGSVDNNGNLLLTQQDGEQAIAGYVGRTKPIELGGGVDLDTVLTPGVYTQSQTAEASAPAANYPMAAAGLLEVFSNETAGAGPANMVWQRYTPYSNYLDRYFIRGNYNSTWSTWRAFFAVDADDTGWVSATTAGFGPAAGVTTAITGSVRRKNGVVSINCGYTKTSAAAVGDLTNMDVITIPTGWRPAFDNGQIGPSGAGQSWNGYARSGGAVTLSNVNIAMATGSLQSASGLYML